MHTIRSGASRRLLLPLAILAAIAAAAIGLAAGKAAAQGTSKADQALVALKYWEYGKAFDLAKIACNEGDLDGCWLMGRILVRTDTGLKQDIPQAVALYKRACDGGNMNGCGSLASLYAEGKGVEKDLVRAVELAQLSCNGGSAVGCTNLGYYYHNGVGVAKNPLRAASLYLRACDDGNAVGCNNLGVLYRDGTGVKEDPAQAAELFSRACDRGFANSCWDAGVAYRDGKGVAANPVNPVVAATLFQRGCDGSNASSCVSLGILYEEGQGVAADQLRAATLYRMGCDAGDKWGCLNLGNNYLIGRGVTKDLAKASEYALKAEKIDPSFSDVKSLLSKIAAAEALPVVAATNPRREATAARTLPGLHANELAGTLWSISCDGSRPAFLLEPDGTVQARDSMGGFRGKFGRWEIEGDRLVLSLDTVSRWQVRGPFDLKFADTGTPDLTQCDAWEFNRDFPTRAYLPASWAIGTAWSGFSDCRLVFTLNPGGVLSRSDKGPTARWSLEDSLLTFYIGGSEITLTRFGNKLLSDRGTFTRCK